MKVPRKKGFFSISAVAKMFSVHQQTIRLYEKEGLINPKRSEGNTRLFSEEDIDKLEEVIYLTHQLGINLAGVEMILKLKKQMSSMQKDMNKLFEKTHAQLDKQTDISKQAVKANMKNLLTLKKEGAVPAQRSAVHESHQENPLHEIHKDESFENENWDIEYEED